MTSHSMEDNKYRRELGGGLVLRWSTKDDVERIGELYSFVFRDKAEEPPNHRVIAWTRDMMSGKHPLIGAHDFAIVEDTDKGVVVASTCLLSQTWEYAGIPFPIGRPEIVASLPDYRNRGLVRAIFELIHARSAANGHMAQGITGIPYYYRQFGYEYAFDLGGSRLIHFSSIPKAKEGEAEPYTLREATTADLPQALALYDRERARGTISTRIDTAYWQYTINGFSEESGEGWYTHMITNNEGRSIGYVLTRRLRWGDTLAVIGMVVEQGVSLLAVLPAVLRGLQAHAEQTNPWKADSPAANKLRFMLGRSHPAYDVLGNTMAPGKPEPYAWYVRVPDLPAFLRHITPVLEQRLSHSVAEGHTGELRIDFYRSGLKLVFEQGRLAAIENWSRGHNWEPGGQCSFPPLVFLQLLFGHRTLDELRHAFPDIWTSDEARPLIEALFPPQVSWVLPLD